MSLPFTEVIISDKGRLHTPKVVPAKRFVPEMKRAKTAVFGKVKPASTVVQLAPLLVDTDTRLPYPVPAKILAPETAKDETEVLKLVSTSFQLAPLFVERKTSFAVPAKIFVPSTARELTYLLERPVLTEVQLDPLFVERWTPCQVSTKTFVPEVASAHIHVSPVSTTVQFVPLFVERKTPPVAVPAKRFVPETARAVTAVSGRPVLTAAQFEPLFVDRKTPFSVAAKRFVPISAMPKKPRNGVFAALQLDPLFVDRKTPGTMFSKDPLLGEMSAKRFVPLKPKAKTQLSVNPLVSTHCECN